MAPRTIPIATLSERGAQPYRDRDSLLAALALTASGAQEAIYQLERGQTSAAAHTLRLAVDAARKQLARMEATHVR